MFKDTPDYASCGFNANFTADHIANQTALGPDDEEFEEYEFIGYPRSYAPQLLPYV